MKADPRGVLSGTHFIDGDHACCEGALAAGARFAAGYPITPSTEVVERFASRIPVVGGTFVQMEDELAASTMTGEIIVGKFVDCDRPDYQSLLRAQMVESLGERYVEPSENVCSCG